MRSVLSFPLCLALFAAAVPATASLARAADETTAANENEELGEHFADIAVPAGLTKEEIQNAIVQALTSREWEIKQKTDRRVVGYLNHRGNEATVTMLLGADQVEIYCEGWAVNKRTGERIKPEQPRGWLKFLQRSLTKAFAEMAPRR